MSAKVETLTRDGPKKLVVLLGRDQLRLNVNGLELDGPAGLLRRVGVDFESRLSRARPQEIEDGRLLLRRLRF